MLGIPEKEMAIDWNTVVFNMLTIKGIYGREMYETWYKMTVMLQSGLDITPVITHRFHYSEFQKGFDACAPANPAKSFSLGTTDSGRTGSPVLHHFPTDLFPYPFGWRPMPLPRRRDYLAQRRILRPPP